MQLKMAKHSIFAHLLRSPWWASLLVALIVSAAAHIFLAEIFGIAAVSMALPFLLISAIAGWRQLRTPSTARIEATIAAVSAIHWTEFSAAMQQGFERKGYEVKRIKGAADFLVTKEERRSLVCCKRWKAATHGIEPLHELQAMREAQDAHGAIYVAINELTEEAQNLSRNYGIELMRASDIMRFLGK